MASLRDQFLKAGLVTKGQADAAEREKRRQEKLAEGNAVARKEKERQEAEARAREAAEREAALIARRREAREREEAQMRVVRCQQILRAHQLKLRPGQQRFYHWSVDRRQALRLLLPEHVATDVRVGRLVIAWVDDARPEAVLIDPATADRVAAIRPELIVFRNTGGVDTDAAQQLYED